MSVLFSIAQPNGAAVTKALEQVEAVRGVFADAESAHLQGDDPGSGNDRSLSCQILERGSHFAQVHLGTHTRRAPPLRGAVKANGNPRTATAEHAG